MLFFSPECFEDGGEQQQGFLGSGFFPSWDEVVLKEAEGQTLWLMSEEFAPTME